MAQPPGRERKDETLRWQLHPDSFLRGIGCVDERSTRVSQNGCVAVAMSSVPWRRRSNAASPAASTPQPGPSTPRPRRAHPSLHLSAVPYRHGVAVWDLERGCLLRQGVRDLPTRVDSLAVYPDASAAVTSRRNPTQDGVIVEAWTLPGCQCIWRFLCRGAEARTYRRSSVQVWFPPARPRYDHDGRTHSAASPAAPRAESSTSPSPRADRSDHASPSPGLVMVWPCRDGAALLCARTGKLLMRLAGATDSVAFHTPMPTPTPASAPPHLTITWLDTASRTLFAALGPKSVWEVTAVGPETAATAALTEPVTHTDADADATIRHGMPIMRVEAHADIQFVALVRQTGVQGQTAFVAVDWKLRRGDLAVIDIRATSLPNFASAGRGPATVRTRWEVPYGTKSGGGGMALSQPLEADTWRRALAVPYRDEVAVLTTRTPKSCSTEVACKMLRGSWGTTPRSVAFGGQHEHPILVVVWGNRADSEAPSTVAVYGYRGPSWCQVASLGAPPATFLRHVGMHRPAWANHDHGRDRRHHAVGTGVDVDEGGRPSLPPTRGGHTLQCLVVAVAYHKAANASVTGVLRLTASPQPVLSPPTAARGTSTGTKAVRHAHAHRYRYGYGRYDRGTFLSHGDDHRKRPAEASESSPQQEGTAAGPSTEGASGAECATDGASAASSVAASRTKELMRLPDALRRQTGYRVALLLRLPVTITVAAHLYGPRLAVRLDSTGHG